MLDQYKLVAFLAVRNADTARAFYRDKLGLRMLSEDRFALVFDVNGTMLRVVPVGEIPSVRWTVLGWEVPDIAAAARQLEAGGVTLERYDWLKPEEKETGIWNAPGGDKVAWFKDPDGNTLSISQHVGRA
ncbi:MAG TPA: VOC family protein [Bryobacteraceae bacterium]|nr:VOC family protein [Bryobacteraceae bacterium]